MKYLIFLTFVISVNVLAKELIDNVKLERQCIGGKKSAACVDLGIELFENVPSKIKTGWKLINHGCLITKNKQRL
jgi:hypothetical protein